MIVLITGGAGFIGSNYLRCHRKLHPDDRLVCCDLLTYAGNPNNLLDFASDPYFVFYKADICDRKAMADIFEQERPDYVVNFAAESHVDRSIDSSDLFLKTNLLGVGVLMDLCLQYHVTRFHQVSTDEVYGDLPLDCSRKFTESDPLAPSSPYSSSKAAADLLALSYHRTYGLDVTISRCSNNYGPYQHPEKLIPRMLTLLERNEPLPIYGTGKNVRDWIWVEDHCIAIERILYHGQSGRVYNVGADCTWDNLSLVKKLCEETGNPKHPIRFVADRKGHDLRYSIDSARIRQELGWQPQMPFAAGLRKTVEWYQENRNWWEPLLDN